MNPNAKAELETIQAALSETERKLNEVKILLEGIKLRGPDTDKWTIQVPPYSTQQGGGHEISIPVDILQYVLEANELNLKGLLSKLAAKGAQAFKEVYDLP